MKSNTGVNQTASKASSHQHRAENKDNLDSRKNEEFDTKGDDVTHNKKEHRNNHPKSHSDNNPNED